MHEDFVLSFAHLCRPSLPTMNCLSLLLDELLLPAPFELLEKPFVIPVPGVTTDLLEVVLKTGVPVIVTPTSDHGVERAQSSHLIEESESPGSQNFEFGLDAGDANLSWPEMNDPPTFRLVSPDIETQKIETVIDVSYLRLLVGQLET